MICGRSRIRVARVLFRLATSRGRIAGRCRRPRKPNHNFRRQGRSCNNSAVKLLGATLYRHASWEIRVLAIGRRLGRVWAVYRDLGPAAVTSRIMRRVKRLFGSDDPAHAEWLAQKTSVDEQFDREYGIQTGGLQEIFGYTIVGNNRRHGLSHIASDPDAFTHLLTKLEVDLSTYR